MGAPLNELPIYVWMDQWDNDFNQERMGALLPKMHVTWQVKTKILYKFIFKLYSTATITQITAAKKG